ncbi:MAG: DUF86 domain-containing protein [Candidatus Zambryskibacteria bacterium]|nr:DUF86 domain-containing protein [Candidatus Zambryskibacteria bacterium]
MKSDKVIRDRIIDCINKIERFTDGVTQKEFFKNEMMQSSVIMQLALIGELSKKISVDFKKHIDLPWRNIAGFRDMAIHDYDDLALKDIWASVKKDIPVMKKALSR